MAFIYFNPNPLRKNVGDCVIRAVSKSTGQEWDDVYMEISMLGYRMADMPSSNDVWMQYLKDTGLRRHIIPDTCPDCYTVNDFCKDHPKGSYVLYIPNSRREGAGHVVAVLDGDFYDTWNSGDEKPLIYWR